jgi:hypothetical protein
MKTSFGFVIINGQRGLDTGFMRLDFIGIEKVARHSWYVPAARPSFPSVDAARENYVRRYSEQGTRETATL